MPGMNVCLVLKNPALVNVDLQLHVLLRVVEGVGAGPVGVAPGLLPEHVPLPHQLHLDLLEGLLLTEVDHQLPADDVPGKVDWLRLVELDEKIPQSAHLCCPEVELELQTAGRLDRSNLIKSISYIV